MTSKTLLIACAILLLALPACDDKSGEKSEADVGVDAKQLAKQAQKKSADEEPDAPARQPDADARTTASSPSRATVNEQPPLDISKLLTKDDFEKLTRTSIVREPLVGKEPGPDYNAARLHPVGSNAYGAGLQVWKMENPEVAVERVQQMRQQYLAVDEVPNDGPIDSEQAFISDRAGVLTYAFPVEEGDNSYVVAVSCGEKLCKKGFEDVAGLADTVIGRLGESEE